MGILRSDYVPTMAPTMRAVVHQTTDGKTVIHQKNDVTALLQSNHNERVSQSIHHHSQTMNHVANVDVFALKNWCEARGIRKRWWMELFADGGKLFREFLNDPDNKVWRTRLGKI